MARLLVGVLCLALGTGVGVFLRYELGFASAANVPALAASQISAPAALDIAQRRPAVSPLAKLSSDTSALLALYPRQWDPVWSEIDTKYRKLLDTRVGQKLDALLNQALQDPNRALPPEFQTVDGIASKWRTTWNGLGESMVVVSSEPVDVAGQSVPAVWLNVAFNDAAVAEFVRDWVMNSLGAEGRRSLGDDGRWVIAKQSGHQARLLIERPEQTPLEAGLLSFSDTEMSVLIGATDRAAFLAPDATRQLVASDAWKSMARFGFDPPAVLGFAREDGIAKMLSSFENYKQVAASSNSMSDLMPKGFSRWLVSAKIDGALRGENRNCFAPEAGSALERTQKRMSARAPLVVSPLERLMDDSTVYALDLSGSYLNSWLENTADAIEGSMQETDDAEVKGLFDQAFAWLKHLDADSVGLLVKAPQMSFTPGFELVLSSRSLSGDDILVKFEELAQQLVSNGTAFTVRRSQSTGGGPRLHFSRPDMPLMELVGGAVAEKTVVFALGEQALDSAAARLAKGKSYFDRPEMRDDPLVQRRSKRNYLQYLSSAAAIDGAKPMLGMMLQGQDPSEGEPITQADLEQFSNELRARIFMIETVAEEAPGIFCTGLASTTLPLN